MVDFDGSVIPNTLGQIERSYWFTNYKWFVGKTTLTTLGHNTGNGENSREITFGTQKGFHSWVEWKCWTFQICCGINGTAC